MALFPPYVPVTGKENNLGSPTPDLAEGLPKGPFLASDGSPVKASVGISAYTPSPTENGGATPESVGLDTSQLRAAISEDLTRCGLERRFPGMGMDAVIESIRHLDADPDYTRPELSAAITLLSQKRGLTCVLFPLRTSHKLRGLSRSIRRVVQIFQAGVWSIEEAVSFVIIHQKKYLWRPDTVRFFQALSYDQLQSLIAYYPWTENWSDAELAAAKSLEAYADRAARLNECCPFRDLEDCEDLYERDLQNSESDQEDGPFIKDEDYYDLLNRHVELDLTKSGLEESFPELPIAEVIADIKALEAKIPHDFTKAEEHFISNYILYKEPSSSLEEELIFRTTEEVAAKVKFLRGKFERKKTFKNNLEQLVYEARWYTTFDGESSRRTRRAASLEDVEAMALADRPTKKIKILTPEEEKLKEERKAIRAAQLERIKEEKRLLAEERKEAAKYRVPRPPKKYELDANQRLLIDAEYFQTVTGNRKKVTAGDKRERRQTAKEIYVVPEFKTRQKLKRVQRNLIKASKRQQQRKPKKTVGRLKPKNVDKWDETSDDEEDDTLEKLLQDQVELSPGVEEDTVSPFDPTSILQDTQVPLQSRKLYFDEIYQDSKQPPLEFNDHTLLDGPNAMLVEDAKIPLVDSLGLTIIADHIKSYRSLPSSFPPAKVVAADELLQINPLNRVRVRNLLYPQHSELYLLAQPKSNELDPVFEIQKIFQIHYALYFSHSETLKRVIYEEYLAKLDEAVVNNDFAAFMFVIDKWNYLMVELCPYEVSWDFSVDINPEARTYLSEVKYPSKEDLNLAVFYNEWKEEGVLSLVGEQSGDTKENGTEHDDVSKENIGIKIETDEENRPQSGVGHDNDNAETKRPLAEKKDTNQLNEFSEISAAAKENGGVKENAHSNGPISSPSDVCLHTSSINRLSTGAHVTGSITTAFVDKSAPSATVNGAISTAYQKGQKPVQQQATETVRPQNYTSQFLQRLRQKTSVSRFCMQQLLLRAYIRVVSPDLRKLRSYKAFTAEVYGELLPSFVSEVLTKVNLLPTQKFYDLGSGVGNTTLQAALEFGAAFSGGCEIMEHASHLTQLQVNYLNKQLAVYGLKELPLKFALLQSFVGNKEVLKEAIDCDVFIINNYLFDFPLNVEVGKLLYGLKPGTKIISLRNFIPPRYKVGSESTVFDYLSVEKHEMSDFLSVSWTANKVPYYISTVESEIRPEYL